MTRDPLRRTRRSVLAVGTVAATLVLAGPATAHHKDGHGSEAQGTADEGDNRHPSGRDRSVEPGGSGTQGRSQSDPDGMSNGGADKPGGSGGLDPADQDGNNGCGNDDDFEDDNNGNCGGPDRGSAVTALSPGTAGGNRVTRLRNLPELAPEVLGDVATRPGVTTPGVTTPGVTTPAGATAAAVPEVLGTKSVRTPPAEVLGVRASGKLPFTGNPLADLAATGLGLLAAGTTSLVVARGRRAS